MAVRTPDCLAAPKAPNAAEWRRMLNGRRYLTAESVRVMSTVQTGDLVTGFTPGNGWGWEYASSVNLRV